MVRITTGNTVLVFIDVQERLMPVMSKADELVERLKVLLRAAPILSIPIIPAEQYPKGLGPTVEELRDLLGNADVVEKVRFSCSGVPDFDTRLETIGRDVVLVAGIEAHVCVQQTVLDLISLGKSVVVLADCISSRREYDKQIAIDRMSHAGAEITTMEAALFELLIEAGTDEFKAISALVKKFRA